MNLMTEAEWLRCEDPARMIFEFGLCSDHRRTRLLLTAHCRRGWDHLSPSSRRAVELAERFAEGAGTIEELARIREETQEEVSYFGVALDHHDPRELEYDPATQSTFARDFTEQELQERQRLRVRLCATAFADAAVRAEYRKVEPFFWEHLPDER